MRELIIKKIVDHWDQSIAIIFDTKLEDVYNMTDVELLDLYNSIFELGL